LEEIEKKYRDLLVGTTVTQVDFFIFGEEVLTIDPEKVWVINAGMEMILGEQKFCFGYNVDMRLWDIVDGELEQLTEEMDIVELDTEEIAGKEKLIGQTIKNIDFNWNWYHKLDENFVPVQEKTYIPIEMIFTFENEVSLQLATIVFSLQEDSILNPKFDSQGQLLVAIDEKVAIEEVD